MKPPKKIEMLSCCIKFYAPFETTENDLDRLCDAIEDEVDNGLRAVAKRIVDKFRNNKLSYIVDGWTMES